MKVREYQPPFAVPLATACHSQPTEQDQIILRTRRLLPQLRQILARPSTYPGYRKRGFGPTFDSWGQPPPHSHRKLFLLPQSVSQVTRGGLIFKAHRLLHHSTLGSRGVDALYREYSRRSLPATAAHPAQPRRQCRANTAHTHTVKA